MKKIVKDKDVIKKQITLLKDIQDVKVAQFTTMLELYQLGEVKEARQIITSLHNTDLAFNFLQLDKDGKQWFLKSMSVEVIHRVLTELTNTLQQENLFHLSSQRLSQVITKLPLNEASRILRNLDQQKSAEVMKRLASSLKKNLIPLLKYEKQTAGSLMTTDLITLRENMSAAKSISQLKKIANKKNLPAIYNLFVIDPQNKLKGKVKISSLLVASPTEKIANLMEYSHSVDTHQDQETVANLATNYADFSLPVVDHQNTLLGEIPLNNIVDIFREEAAEDINLIAGTTKESFNKHTLQACRERILWLIMGLIGGIIAALIVNTFQLSFTKTLALAFFIPLIMGMGGNVAIQASSLIVKHVSLNMFKITNVPTMLLREIKISLINGLILSTLLFILIFIASHFITSLQTEITPVKLGFTISVSLFMVIFTSSFLGISVPLALDKMKIDPAIAMGPFITILNDITSLFIYLVVSKIILF